AGVCAVRAGCGGDTGGGRMKILRFGTTPVRNYWGWRYTDIPVALQFTLVTQDVHCCFNSTV
ncbi:MAG: hypothetical protein J7J03_06625, partial [Methanosarcinales archaeon]|nr:hypothetical protein [Methanosarcinales archaeon]